MKKVIGYLAAHFCFWLGHLMHKVSSTKVSGKFYFDKAGWRFRAGYWMAGQYQKWTHRSIAIQDWAGNKSPWKPIAK